MGRHVGRSRGCKVCMQRRIKCDETFPECSECLRSGRKCPGPLKGTLFLDMSSKITRGVKASSLTDTPELNSCNPSPSPPETDTIQDRVFSSEPAQSGKVVVGLLRLPSNYQPNRGDIFQQLYISHLVFSHDPLMHPWIPYLSDMLSSPLNSNFSTGIIAIRAASMAFYSKLTANKDLEFEATRWYSKGLEAQRKKLLDVSTTDHYDLDAMNGAVCSAMVFSLFESIISTTPIGWLQHVRAAGRMLDIAGPERCQIGLMYMYFKSVRLTSISTSMILEEPSVFASESWCTVPFEKNPKQPLDELLDIMLQLPSYLPGRKQMLKLRTKNPTTSDAAKRNLGTTLQYILNRLNQFWELHKSEIDPNYDFRIKSRVETGCCTTIPFESVFAATFTSLYDSANIIACTYLASISPTPNTYYWKATVHAASILSSIAYHESQGPKSGGSFSMLFPMRILSLMSPSEKQKELAHETLVKWGKERGLDGVSITRVTSLEEGKRY